MKTLNSTMKWSGVSDFVAIGATSAQSAAFSSHCQEVRIVCTSDAWIKFGVNPTAAATDNNGLYMPAGAIEYFHVTPGEKVAVIQDTAAGSMCVAEMSR